MAKHLQGVKSMTSIHVSGKESRQKLLALLGELRPEDVSCRCFGSKVAGL